MRVVSQYQSAGNTNPITSCDIGIWAPSYTEPWFGATEPFAQRLEEAGFKILYKLQSKGLAPYKTEDPVVIRIIAQKL